MSNFNLLSQKLSNLFTPGFSATSASKNSSTQKSINQSISKKGTTMQTIGINGFGRIGRTSFRIWWEKHQDKLDLTLINTSGSMDLKSWVHLLKYDTNYGPFKEKIVINEEQSNKEVTDENPVLGTIKIGNKTITFTAQREPQKVPWAKYGVETVLEATGSFVKEEGARLHLEAGAKKVLISAPGKEGNISTSVIGVNEFGEGPIYSNASCTTNCIAPVVKIINDSFGIKKAIMTTIHSYTDDQNVQDNSHKKDLRRARAAAENLIPTSTGAAKATTKIMPQLKGLFDGMAVRVPTPVGSLSDMVFVTSRATSAEEVNQALVAASQGAYQGIVAVTDEPIVSSDIIGREESSIVDLSLTQVIDGDLVKVVSWYDNEWGYCCRLLDQVYKI